MRNARLALLLVLSLAAATPAGAVTRTDPGWGSGLVGVVEWLVALWVGSEAAEDIDKGCAIDPNGQECARQEEDPESVSRKGCDIDPNGIPRCEPA